MLVPDYNTPRHKNLMSIEGGIEDDEDADDDDLG